MSNLFSIGTSALLANQRALSVTSNNIANVNTDGYSRQGVDFEPRHVPGQIMEQGVSVGEITRFADPFANTRLVQSSAEHAALETGATLTRRLDAVLSEEQTGLAGPLRQFLDSIDGLAADPSSVEARVEVLGDAEALAQRFTQIQGQFDNLNSELNARVSGSVSQINDLSAAIARLNDEIARSNSVSPPNVLLDERDRLVSQLAEQIDVNTAVQNDGSVNVFVGSGQALVVGNTVSQLSVAPGATPADPARVLLGGGDISGQVAGGELGGIFGFREDVMQPAQLEIRALAQAVSSTVNDAQAAGTDFNGNPGQPLFQIGSSGAGLSVLITDPQALAAAGPQAPAGSGDNSNALALSEALRAPVLGQNNLQEANLSLVGRVGTQARSLEAAERAQAAVVSQQQFLRDQVSGVNLDEEAANLLRYQQSYQAAAQIIATANAMFESLLAAAR